MKKTYIAPTVKSVKIRTASLIAASTGITTSTTNAGKDETVLGRESRFSTWDDEE